jgi:hypothetical protein
VEGKVHRIRERVASYKPTKPLGALCKCAQVKPHFTGELPISYSTSTAPAAPRTLCQPNRTKFFFFIFIYFSSGHRLPLTASHECLELPSLTLGIGMSKGKPFLSLSTVSKHLPVELLQCLLLARPAALAFTCSPASRRSSQHLLLWPNRRTSRAIQKFINRGHQRSIPGGGNGAQREKYGKLAHRRLKTTRSERCLPDNPYLLIHSRTDFRYCRSIRFFMLRKSLDLPVEFLSRCHPRTSSLTQM